MKIKTTLALAAAALLAASAGPAFAKASIQGGQNACKAAFDKQTPAPASTRLLEDQTRVSNSVLVYVYRVKTGEASNAVTCTVDRDTSTAKLTTPADSQQAAK